MAARFDRGAPVRCAWRLLAAVTRRDDRRRAVATVPLRAPADRRAVEVLLEAAPTADHRARVAAAVAAGAPVPVLAAFAERLAVVEAAGLPALLDPTARPAGTLRQQSATTCGSASLVVARMLVDPVHSLWVLDGFDAVAGRHVPGTVEARFAAQEQAVMARTNTCLDRDGGRRPPWPRALGTPPWGAAEELTHGGGVPGVRYRVRLVDPDSPVDRLAAFDALAGAVRHGRPCLLYVGSDALPRHVVAVVGGDAGRLLVHEPGAGAVVPLPRDAFGTGDLRRAGWPRPWAVVVP